MARIDLEIARTLHQPSLASGYSLPVARLLTSMSLRTSDGWTPAHRAVIDTGATVSLLPRSAWVHADFRTIVSVRTAGVVNRPECMISATLATVQCVLLQEHERVGPLTIHALLADSDRVPLLLGMSGALDELRLVIDLPQGSASLEAREF